MLLRFKDRTWMLLGKLIEKGEKEGIIRHIELPRDDWEKLRREWIGLSESDRRAYMRQIKVISNDGLPVISPEIFMDEDFVDQWVESKYDIYYRDVNLVPDNPEWSEIAQEDKATAETERLG